ncbi:MAG TPA: N-acetylglucosamine-6-phosphate deacetylase [Solirubrobacteraceae bacterium]
MRLRSRRIVCPGVTLDGEVVVRGGGISWVGPASGGPSVSDDEVFDLGDRWLVPGYIDPHVHGGGGAQCNTSDAQEIAAVARFHARHGTTGLIATTVAAPIEELEDALDAIARCKAPTLLGAHLEGPFLSRKRRGAMDPEAFIEPDVEQLRRLVEAGAGQVRVMTLAPELPGSLELVELLVRESIVASIGHTDATEAEVRAAVDAGANAATHVFNAMAPFHHREPGAVGAVLDLPGVSCELICDGVHVDPVAMRLLLRAKGVSGMRLVTDATSAAGMPDGEYPLGGRHVSVAGGRAVLADGESIAGSTLTMEEAVQNAVRILGVTVEEAILMASANSARLLGMEGRKGEISAGSDADMLVLDDVLAVQATMVAGQWVFGAL